MPHSQDNKSIAIKTPLGDNDLLLASFTGVEGISRLFNFRLELLSEKARDDISFKKIIGATVTIRVGNPDAKHRFFNGVVSRFAEISSDDSFAHYQMEVVPEHWFLTRRSDCRIFQNKSVLDIIQAVLGDAKVTSFKDQTTRTYPQEEYVVQYRETDFNFVSRLMEKYGIFYFYEHDQSAHKMVLADSSSAHPDVESGGALSYYVGGVDDENVISSWKAEQELHPGKHTLTDYNFQQPTTDLKSSLPSVFEAGQNKNYEIYDYPGEYLVRDDGSHLVKTRMEETEASHFLVHGSGFCRAFTSGYKFDLKDHPRSTMNASYILTEVTHSASAGGYGTGGGAPSYSNQFTCMPASLDENPLTFRPPRTTRIPFVQGPQTAVVVGESGEEIWPDKYGRVKVQFHWDRLGKKDANSSCWIRVSQPWAGGGWGGMWIPRVGQEVIVSFEEGNPDRPIITGRVYNDNQKVPYPLPDNKTVSTMWGNSSKGGGGRANELRFEDKKGDEQVFINAQKDLDVQVLNDAREYIKANRNLIIEQDQKELVKGNKHNQVKQDFAAEVDGKYSLKVTQGIAIESQQEIHLKAPKIVIEGDAQVSLKVGGNFVDINPATVAIKGTMVLINSGGSAGSGGSPASPKAPDQADDGTQFKKKS